MANIFIAARIREPEVLRELNIAWACVTGILPEIAQTERAGPPHITLRYLGDLEIDHPEADPTIQELSESMRDTAQRFESFDLLLGYLHTFPGILWTSVGGTDDALESLEAMQKRIDKAASQSNLTPVPKRHDFVPHITLGTFNQAATPAIQVLIKDSQYPSQVHFAVDRLELLQSTHDDNGAKVYSTIGATAPLLERT